MSHAFIDSGERRPDKAGRMLKVCGECGRSNIGTAHSLTTEPVPMPVSAVPPREVRMLALALDAVLALPPDVLGWRVSLRANDLRSAITDIPREVEPALVTIPKPMPDMPVVKTHQAPVRARARSSTKSIKNEQMRAVATRAVEHGWHLAKTGSGHYRLEKEGKSLIFSATTGDNRAWRNFRALAKRHGIDVEDI